MSKEKNNDQGKETAGLLMNTEKFYEPNPSFWRENIRTQSNEPTRMIFDFT